MGAEKKKCEKRRSRSAFVPERSALPNRPESEKQNENENENEEKTERETSLSLCFSFCFRTPYDTKFERTPRRYKGCSSHLGFVWPLIKRKIGSITMYQKDIPISARFNYYLITNRLNSLPSLVIISWFWGSRTRLPSTKK